MILLPKAAVDRNAQLDAGEVKVWLMRSQESFLEEKYTSSPYLIPKNKVLHHEEVIFTDEILRVFLRDLHDPMSLNKTSACFSVNNWILQRFFPRPPVTAEGGQRLLEDGICLNKNVKQFAEMA